MAKHFSLGLACLLLTMSATTVRATDQYNNLTDFLAATQPGYYLENFNGFFEGPQGPSLAFGPVNGFSYTISALNDLYTGNGIMSTNTATDPLEIAFTGAPVTAVGGNFWPTDIVFNTIPGNITVNLSDGTSAMLTNPTPSTFLGFTSTTPITSMSIASSGATTAWPTMDNFYVGAAIPEPATLAVLGLGALLVVRRRR